MKDVTDDHSSENVQRFLIGSLCKVLMVAIVCYSVSYVILNKKIDPLTIESCQSACLFSIEVKNGMLDFGVVREVTPNSCVCGVEKYEDLWFRDLR